ncbi:amidohydrolase [Mycobacterium saskatchewanense]|uniref:Amidohydrolase n=1 Tax=Mycobacterium saskatchewanense TaxID=220927 RepID=A0AAJ3NPI9_9MYCO|nr:amidohydrolase family protein [Mycobacterium saskatchewanense]ORW70990.1 amidohydrolase [Mycobacterium saskatchewanense]BBX66182.1 amidohydrolase [Mycobacterium saskatchewanense]
MRYIALEEAFSIPGIAEPMSGLASRETSFAQQWLRKLPDFTQYRIPEMDAAGIDIQVLSLTVPGLQADLDADTARGDARRANDYLAQTVAEHPTRFRGFAALPLQDPRAAVTELERCVTELGFCGALVNDHLGGRYLDEPLYEPLWEALESLAVPLYLHPGTPPADRWRVLTGHPELYGAMWSWAAEVSGHALRVVCGGVFDRHPSATLILGHMGEFLPFQRSRLDSRYATIHTDYRLQRPPSAYLGTNVVFTTSGVFSPAALTGAVLEVGADAIMFSVDYPYESSQEAVDGFERTTLSPGDREKIAHANAERILKI